MMWHKTSPYSIAAGEQGEYAVSRATVLDTATRALVDRFSAWYVLPQPEESRYTGRPAQLLGIRQSAAEAKAVCQAHRDAAVGRKPDLQTPDAA